VPEIPIILNPISGHGLGLRVLPAIEEGLRSLGFTPRVCKTEQAGEAREFAAAAPDDSPYMVCMGGDGTLNEVLNGVVPRHIPVAIFPTGTGNVFCKDIGVRSSVESFLSLFKEGRIKRYDIGFVNERSFISVAGAGFNAEVVRRMEGLRRGNMRMIEYVLPTMQTLLGYAFPPIRVEVDGEVICEDGFLVEIGNVSSYGGPMQFTTLALPDDGLLDVCVFRKSNRIKVIKHFFGTVTRMHLRYSEVVYAKGRNVRLSSTGTVPTHVDGDGNGNLPARYRIEPMAASVLVPQGR